MPGIQKQKVHAYKHISFDMLPRKAQSHMPTSRARSTCLCVHVVHTDSMQKSILSLAFSIGLNAESKPIVPEHNGQYGCDDWREDGKYSRNGQQSLN